VNWGDEVQYRLELAEGFLNEAKQDAELKRSRSCVDNAQLSIENSVKAVLAVFGPVGKTHDPWLELQDLLKEGSAIPSGLREAASELAALAAKFGTKEHFLTDYGDESRFLSPWKLFDEEDAREAKETAERCFVLSKEITDKLLSES
jgi:HEPN domain-containing protein